MTYPVWHPKNILRSWEWMDLQRNICKLILQYLGNASYKGHLSCVGFTHSAQLTLSWPISAPTTDLFIRLNKWPVASMNCSQVQSGVGSNSRLALTLSLYVAHLAPLEIKGQADPYRPWFGGNWRAECESSPTEQNVRPCLSLEEFLKNPADGEGSCWIKGCFVDLWCNTSCKTDFYTARGSVFLVRLLLSFFVLFLRTKTKAQHPVCNSLSSVSSSLLNE